MTLLKSSDLLVLATSQTVLTPPFGGVGPDRAFLAKRQPPNSGKPKLVR